jgi:membrane-associated phospholipid phosphatase
MASDTIPEEVRGELDDLVQESAPIPAERRPRWYLQIPLVVAFYWMYANIRDLHGDATMHPQSARIAERHGVDVLHLERVLHIDIEWVVQKALLPYHWLVQLLGGFYGSAHFVITAFAFGFLLFCATPARYRYWRNVLAIGTLLGLACFALYPTMPPRLLPHPQYPYVDTMYQIGGLWSYNRGVLEHISDPFAAMPSLHIVWSGWCCLALWHRFRAPWQHRLLVAYPLLTGFAVIVTGNHWVLDLVAGALVLAAAWGLNQLGHRLAARRRLARELWLAETARAELAQPAQSAGK